MLRKYHQPAITSHKPRLAVTPITIIRRERRIKPVTMAVPAPKRGSIRALVFVSAARLASRPKTPQSRQSSPRRRAWISASSANPVSDATNASLLTELAMNVYCGRMAIRAALISPNIAWPVSIIPIP